MMHLTNRPPPNNWLAAIYAVAVAFILSQFMHDLTHNIVGSRTGAAVAGWVAFICGVVLIFLLVRPKKSSHNGRPGKSDHPGL
jgi:hypothetical protein